MKTDDQNGNGEIPENQKVNDSKTEKGNSPADDSTRLDGSGSPHHGASLKWIGDLAKAGVPCPRERWYNLGPFESAPLPGAKVIEAPFEFPWGVYTMGNTPAHDAGSDLLLCLDLERALLCGYLQLMRDGMEPLEPAEIAIARAMRNC
jgi:hypothetical protein